MPRNLSITQPWSITLIYIVVGLNWIFFSDTITTYVCSDDIIEMSKFQMGKGFFYVLVSGLLLFSLINRLYQTMNNGKQELELLFTNPNFGILKVDEKGYFTKVSNNILKITGYSTDEIIGKHILHFTPPDKRQLDFVQLQHIANAASEEGFEFTNHLQNKNGEMSIIKANGIVVKSKTGQTTGYLAAFQNITDQEMYLHSLKSKNKQLRDIASDQSHLVRAPLARILSIIELVQNVELDSAEQTNLIKHLKSSGEELDSALKGISKKMNSHHVV